VNETLIYSKPNNALSFFAELGTLVWRSNSLYHCEWMPRHTKNEQLRPQEHHVLCPLRYYSTCETRDRRAVDSSHPANQNLTVKEDYSVCSGEYRKEYKSLPRSNAHGVPVIPLSECLPKHQTHWTTEVALLQLFRVAQGGTCWWRPFFCMKLLQWFRKFLCAAVSCGVPENQWTEREGQWPVNVLNR